MGGGAYKHKPKHGGRVKQKDQGHEPPKPKSLTQRYEDDTANSIGQALLAIMRNDRDCASLAPAYNASDTGLTPTHFHRIALRNAPLSNQCT